VSLLDPLSIARGSFDNALACGDVRRLGRVGLPSLYNSAFPAKNGKAPSHIGFSAASDESHYDVSPNNRRDDPRPAWLYEHELGMQGR
jgi:hypothetical protein